MGDRPGLRVRVPAVRGREKRFGPQLPGFTTRRGPVALDEGLVRVAHHEHVGLVARDLAGQARVAAIVGDQETEGRHFHEQELRQPQEGRTRVVVAADGLDGCDPRQSAQEGFVDQITGHQDASDAGKDLGQKGVEAAVEVGHDAEAHEAIQDDCSSLRARRQASADASSWAAENPAARLIQA